MENRNDLEVWRLAPLHLMWCIWRERNARSFEDREIVMLDDVTIPLYMESCMECLPVSNFF